MHGLAVNNVVTLAFLLSLLSWYPPIGSEGFDVKSIVTAVKLTWDGDFSEAYQVWHADSPLYDATPGKSFLYCQTILQGLEEYDRRYYVAKRPYLKGE